MAERREDWAVPRWLQGGAAFGWRFLVLAAAAAVVGVVVARLSIVVLPLAIALLIAAVLAPVAGWLREHGLPDGLAAPLVVVVGIALLAGAIGGASWALAGTADELGQRLGAGFQTFVGWLGGFPGLSEEQARTTIQELPQQLLSGGGSGGLVAGARAVFEMLAMLLLTVFFAFFFIKEGERMFGSALRLVPGDRRERLRETGLRVWGVLGRFMRGLTAVALINSLLNGLALLLIGVPLILPLMVITFIGSFVPFLGPTIAAAAAALVALAEGSVLDAGLVLLAGFAIQQIEGNFLSPVIYGKALDLHPVLVLIAITVGVTVAGLAGALLAVPLTAAGVAVAKELGEATPDQAAA